MRRPVALAACLIGAAGCSRILGLNDVTLVDGASGGDAPGEMQADTGVDTADNPGAGAAPRLVAPLSMSTVTQQRPTLRWQLDAAGAVPIIELCRDRACTMPIATSLDVAVDRRSAVPTAALPPGWVFWRVSVTAGAVRSATWQFWVGKASASTGVDTSHGAILDVNGDGYPDFLVGADGASTGPSTAHLYLGSATVTPTAWNAAASSQRIDLTNPDGDDAAFGFSVASAGDVNGDGYADFLVGANGAQASAGRAHVYLGSPAPSAAGWNPAGAPNRIDLENLDGDNAIFGTSLAGAGDVNGDGYADFLIGASKADVAHLYLGSATPSASDWNGGTFTGRIDLPSPEVFATFGNAVAGVGDVNGDGYADFVVAAAGASSGDGLAHLYLGSAAPSASVWTRSTTDQRLDLADVDGASAAFGYAVGSAGDVNGDGYSDFLIGSRKASANQGSAHLYLGSAGPTAIDWNQTTSATRLDLSNPDGAVALFGSSVASAGDVDGDGYGDFVIGAPSAGAGTGAAYCYRGASTLTGAAWNGAASSARIDLSSTLGANAHFGESVASAGDVNGDGYADFLVGANDAAAGAGAVRLYLGAVAPSAATWNGASSAARIELSSPAGAGARFGASLARLGEGPPARRVRTCRI